MNTRLLDTNILSEFLRRTPSQQVMKRVARFPQHQLCTSVICVMELRAGAMLHPQPQRLWSRIQRELVDRGTALPVSDEVALRAGDLLARLRRTGKTADVSDALIAATCLANGCILVTRNTKHFIHVPGLTVENWFA